MKRVLRTLTVLALSVAPLVGCQQKTSEVQVPPVPTPRYLSRDVAPETGRTVTPVEPATPAETTESGKTPDEVAAEVREAVNRLQENEFASRNKLTKLPPDGAPSLTESGPAGRTGDVELTEIKPVDPTAVPVPPAPGQEKTTTPAATPPKTVSAEAPQGEVTLENLTKHYEELARANPGDVEVARTLRFLHFLSGDDAGSLEAIPGLPPDEQNLWHWMMASMIAARDRVPGMTRADQAAEVLEDLERVRAILKKEAPLELGEVRFCHEISTFGDYEPLETNRFKFGEQTKLYAELRNFATEKGSDGLYRVRLNVSLSLERPDGTSVWQETIPNVEDKCRRPRQDFFLRVHFPIPKDVRPGSYILKVTFEDTLANKQAGARLSLDIVDR